MIITAYGLLYDPLRRNKKVEQEYEAKGSDCLHYKISQHFIFAIDLNLHQFEVTMTCSAKLKKTAKNSN